MTTADDLKISKLTCEQIILVTGEKGLDAVEEMCKDGILIFQEGIFFLSTEVPNRYVHLHKEIHDSDITRVCKNLDLEAHEKYGNQCSSVGFVCYLSDGEAEEKKISINRYQFIDAKNKLGEIKPFYRLSTDEGQVREDKILINLNSTSLTDIQLQNGQIINLNQSPLSIKQALNNAASAIQPGGGGGI